MDRRLGDRHSVLWLRLTWDVERRGRWRTRTDQEPVTALDVSVSGVSVAGATAPGVDIGSTVTLYLGEHQAGAVVQRVQPSASPGDSIYGLQFVSPSWGFITALLEAGDESTTSAEDYWNRAR